MAVEHVNIADPDIHEPKGAASASADEVYVANGSNSGAWKDVGTRNTTGWWSYEDVTTVGSPIALTSANTQYELTNDGAGTTSTSAYAPTGFGEIWNTSTDRFDFTDFKLGDTLDFCIQLEINLGGAGSVIDLQLETGIGGTTNQTPLISDKYYKSGSTTYDIITYVGMAIGSNNILDNPARILARSDSTGTTVTFTNMYMRLTGMGA